MKSIQNKIKSSIAFAILLFMARRKGLDGLCPSLLRNTRLCSPSARGGSSSLYSKQQKKKSNHENVISLLLARRKGLDGLCPSLLRNTRLCSPSARGFESLVFKVTKKEEQPRKRDFSSFGAPEGTRTPDLLVRSQTLYPTELPALIWSG